MVTQWSPGASRSPPPCGTDCLAVRTAVLVVCSSVGEGGVLTRDDGVIARRWASAWARTLAKPAGLVMRAACPASEVAQRLHSSNFTAWSASNWSTGTEGSTKAGDWLAPSEVEGGPVTGDS